ncbi:hypothetical protein DQW77_13375 [Roseovarius sp. TE539]|uniref:hypothetical protein n=1 Tax=Roseovarius sp. TE539 TaxID=2249812 RepID=UPI000E0570D1|nr:hypothetical protein [Roseovarius sp. TE539]RBI70818.1 hypothetical protein DQW77_13375 [Roseovarius sp. TE539]
MKKLFMTSALAASLSLTALPLAAGQYEAPVMEPEIIEAETAASSANSAEIVALTLTAITFILALVKS